MCGLPFSGKTTLSKQIAKHTNSRRISFDELWLELEKNLQNKNHLTWDLVVSEAKKRIADYLERGSSVVYDDTNAKKEHRDALSDIAKDHQSHSQIVYLDVPKEVIFKRREQNLSSHSRHDVEDENFNSVLNQFEEPSHIENVIVFKPDDEVEKWLEGLLKE